MFISIVVGVVSLLAEPHEFTTEVEDYRVDSAVLQIVETVNIPAQAVGPIMKLSVKQGDLISTNDVLAQIDDREAQLKLGEARIELAIAAEQADSSVDVDFALKSKAVAVADLQRAEESNRKYQGVVSDREMDRLRLLVEQSDAELKKIRFEKSLLRMRQKLKQSIVDQGMLSVEQHKIRSAIQGQVVEIQKRPGEWVNLADPVFQVVRLDRLRVEEYLPVEIATSSLANCKAVFIFAEQKLFGKVVFVSPEINPLNSTVMVRMEFENPNLTLRPGMTGTVDIIRSEHSPESLGRK